MGASRPPRIPILNESPLRVKVEPVRRALRALLVRYHRADGSIDVLLAGDQRLRELNREHRGIDEATDVLSFPSGDPTGKLIGSVAISVEFAQRGAQARGVGVAEETAFLAIHGGLHLMGLDDRTESERAGMIEAMNKIASDAGLPMDEAWASQPHREGG